MKDRPRRSSNRPRGTLMPSSAARRTSTVARSSSPQGLTTARSPSHLTSTASVMSIGRAMHCAPFRCGFDEELVDSGRRGRCPGNPEQLDRQVELGLKLERVVQIGSAGDPPELGGQSFALAFADGRPGFPDEIRTAATGGDALVRVKDLAEKADVAGGELERHGA